MRELIAPHLFQILATLVLVGITWALVSALSTEKKVKGFHRGSLRRTW